MDQQSRTNAILYKVVVQFAIKLKICHKNDVDFHEEESEVS